MQLPAAALCRRFKNRSYRDFANWTKNPILWQRFRSDLFNWIKMLSRCRIFYL